MKPTLDVESLLSEAARFARAESAHHEPTLYGVTDGKAVGTYLEHKFRDWLSGQYAFDIGSSARGIDFPGLNTDMKVTSVKQPQSSSPYRSPRQKVQGLGYSLLVFVYDKSEDEQRQTATMRVLHTIFVHESRTADYQMTRGIREIIERDGNVQDLVGFMHDRNLPIDDGEAAALAAELIERPPAQGYLTISNALQWRLQYQRAIDSAGTVDGVTRIGDEGP